MEKLVTVLTLAILLSACATTSEPGAAAREPDAPAESDPRMALLEAENVRLRREARRLGEEAASTEFKRLAADRAIEELNRQLEATQRLLNEARAEIVRAQAKMRGSVGQADAAANIAEAELAIEGARSPNSREIVQSRALLSGATSAFDEGNYGGAFYLSDQAKRLVSRVAERQVAQVLAPVEDETPFAATLPLVLTSNANLRSGPGTDNPIVETLESGTAVDAYSHKGVWLRVWLEDGRDGWIYQSLVTARPANPSPPPP